METNIETSTNTFFLKEYEFSSLKNIHILPGVNNLCRIYDAVLEEKSEDNSLAYQNVFLVCFKLFENDEYTIEKLKKTMEKSEQQINKNPELKYFFLTRCGFAQNKVDQSFYLIYVNNGNKLINLELFHRDNKKQNSKLIRLCYFNQFLNFVSKLHENKMRVQILNPNMIFHSKICGYQLFGYFFYEFFKDYDLVQNFPLAIYFGYFDPEILSEIHKDETLRYKADIVLLCIFLGYLFSYDNTKSEDDIIFIPYGRILFQLHADYVSHDKSFSRFINLVHDEEVKKFLQNVLKLNYRDIPTIDECVDLFNAIVEKNLQNSKCVDCKFGSKHANRLNLLCNEFLCNDCFYRHECNKIKGLILLRVFEKFNLNKLYLEKSLKSFHELPPITEQVFEYHFNTHLNAKFHRIANEHEKIERYTKMQEDKINNMVEYIESRLNAKINNLEEEINALKEKIDKKQITGEYLNEDLINSGQESKIFNYEFPEGSLIDNPMLLRIINTNNNQGIENKEFEDKLYELKKLLDISKDAKKSLNFNIKFNSAMDNLKYKSQIYLDQLKKEFFINFNETVEKFTSQLNELYDKTGLSSATSENYFFGGFDTEGKIENSLDIYKLHLMKQNENIATVDIKQNSFIIINYKNTEDEKFLPTFPRDYRPEPRSIMQNCRWVNLKNILFVSGGVYRDIEGKEVCSKKAFFIEYEAITSNQTRVVHVVKEMIEGRDQHCLLYANDYYVIAIGGFRTKTCEQYNLLKNEWTPLPSLEVKLYNTSAVLFNNINVYVFFGLISPPKNKYDLNFNQEIYRLKLPSSNKEDDKWERINYKGERISLCLNSLLNVNETEIYIIGGRNQGDNFSNFSYRFEPFTGNLSQNNMNLGKKLCFLESNFLKIPEEEFALYSSDFHFVKFKI